jgi:hypothetical protein
VSVAGSRSTGTLEPSKTHSSIGAAQLGSTPRPIASQVRFFVRAQLQPLNACFELAAYSVFKNAIRFANIIAAHQQNFKRSRTSGSSREPCQARSISSKYGDNEVIRKRCSLTIDSDLTCHRKHRACSCA